MNNKSVTILKTWDDEIIEIEQPFETWLSVKMSAKNK